MADVVVDGFALCGVLLSETGSVSASNTLIRGGPSGACADESADLSGLLEGVRVVDVETALMTSMLPVPAPAAPLTSPQ
jgi:hypothetical protein